MGIATRQRRWLWNLTAGGGGGGGVFDPTTSDPDAWWRANFAAPWTPTASAGSSASRGNLVTLGVAPSAGTAVNGFTPASFNGSSQSLQLGTANTTDLISTSAFTGIVLARLNGTVAAASDFYDDPALFTDSGGNAALVATSSGIRAGTFDSNSDQTVHIAQATGSWFFAAMRRNATHVKCRVNSTDATPVGAGAFTLSGNMFFGANYSQAKRAQIDVLETVFYKRELSDADLTNWKDYFNNRYALSL